MERVSCLFPVVLSVGRDGSGAGAVDEEDFIQAFEDVPTVQVWRFISFHTHTAEEERLKGLPLICPSLPPSARSTPTGRWRRP